MTKEQRELYEGYFASAYYWHSLFLEFKFLGEVVIQATNILTRWSLLVKDDNKAKYSHLLARAAQSLESCALVANIKFPFCKADIKLHGIDNIVVELASNANKLVWSKYQLILEKDHGKIDINRI